MKPPGLEPELFAPGVISTNKNEINSIFTLEGKEFYFASFRSGDSGGGVRGYTIMVMKEERAGWTEPRVAPFSGEYSDVDMFITHDGKQFFFISK